MVVYELLLNVDQLNALSGRDDVVIFDVRHDLADLDAGRGAYHAGHVPGACFLDHEEDLSAPKTGGNGRHPLPPLSEFSALMSRYGVKPGVQVVVYDAGNSMFAAHLWWMLRWIGHDKVAVLDGGWQAWLEAGGSVSTDIPTPPTHEMADQAVVTQPVMPVVDTETVLKHLSTSRFTIIDARAENRFKGEVEPMDPVAGHIPGALNRPNTLNLQEDGRFRSAHELKLAFNALLGSREPQTVVHQCGSGITACHNLFAMQIAGLKGSALYPGSWSEWCSDPARPVETGAG